MDSRKVWFVTGASKGLGLTLVKKLLAQNYCVAATSRNVNNLIKELGDTTASFLPIEMNLSEDVNVKQAIKECVNHFGQLDVVVNNAGFSLIGTLEELSAEEVKTSFDINVFGTLNVIRHAAPYLRKQRSGYIMNIASIGGYDGGYPGFGVYCATKFAIVGLTEGLAHEMKEFGVNVSVIYPGYFRTSFLTAGSLQIAKQPISEYTSARAMEQAHMNDINGNQPNDPEKAAEIMIKITEHSQPPLHLFLGKDAYAVVEKKNAVVQKDMKDFQELATATAFDQ